MSAKDNPSRETVPLSFISYLQRTCTTWLFYVRILNVNREGWSSSTLPPLYKTHLYIWVPQYIKVGPTSHPLIIALDVLFNPPPLLINVGGGDPINQGN